MMPVSRSLSIRLLAAVVLGCVAASAWGQAAGIGWYTGFGIGRSGIGFKAEDFALGGAGVRRTADEDATGLRFFAGYRFLPWFAIEGGYGRLGRFGHHFTGPGGMADLSFRVDGLKLSGVGSIDLGNTGFSAFGKLGFFYGRVRQDSANFPAVLGRADFSAREWHGTTLAGVGLQYRLPRGLALRAEYEHFGELGDAPVPVGRARTSVWSLSLMYLF
jgi:OOP family OmpA-OmpF porin